MRVIRGKTALVTGAASGIGRAIALGLAREGADLVLLDINGPALSDVVAEARDEYGVLATGQPCDISDPLQVTAFTRGLMAAKTPLDILVNNAGILYYGATDEMSVSQWQRLLAVNLRAPVQLVCELLPTLLSRPQAHILNIASMSGFVGFPHAAGYSATKFGLLGFGESLRAEYSHTNLGVTTVCPGVVRTEIWNATADGMPQLPQWLTTVPERVAEKAIRAIYKNKGLVVITPLARMLHLLHRFAPGLLALHARIQSRRLAAAKAAQTEEQKKAA
jgi:short-subunit dehydrogenase